MKSLVILPLLLLLFDFSPLQKSELPLEKALQNTDSIELTVKSIWDESNYKSVISFDLFLRAMKGYYSYDAYKKGIISIVDYSKPSTEKRFYVIDLVKNKLLYHTLIAHGKNTGENMAKNFSNTPNSLKSSLGFFKTAETYFGKHGFSLRLDGLEKGINQKARKRAIVIHGANYVSSDFAKRHGRLGRSWGCPALPVSETKSIINTIKNGTCLFIYGKSKAYDKNSTFLD